MVHHIEQEIILSQNPPLPLSELTAWLSDTYCDVMQHISHTRKYRNQCPLIHISSEMVYKIVQ